jgi:hypothetical protein
MSFDTWNLYQQFEIYQSAELAESDRVNLFQLGRRRLLQKTSDLLQEGKPVRRKVPVVKTRKDGIVQRYWQWATERWYRAMPVMLKEIKDFGTGNRCYRAHLKVIVVPESYSGDCSVLQGIYRKRRESDVFSERISMPAIGRVCVSERGGVGMKVFDGVQKKVSWLRSIAHPRFGILTSRERFISSMCLYFARKHCKYHSGNISFGNRGMLMSLGMDLASVELAANTEKECMQLLLFQPPEKQQTLEFVGMYSGSTLKFLPMPKEAVSA